MADRLSGSIGVVEALQSRKTINELPAYYGSWSSAYSFFWRLQKAGIWDIILDHVSIEPDWSQVMIDTTVVRVHQHGSGAKGGKLSKQSSRF
ncbi:hypothetical protein PaeBR_15640 [Paenibacillus sp. BR2-3]|uniref:hypothetical protein n=1 Tax=Paenibacillus sp. BR2-3 TaxID=3048494 RepID=UPI00397753E0